MPKTFIFLAPGFEETEAIVPIDILRRAQIEVETESITSQKEVTGAHGVTVLADSLFENTDFSKGDMLVLPGGMPGASNLNAHQGLKNLLLQYAEGGKKIAAICAAPLVLGGLDLLQGKKATAYPGYESTLKGAEYLEAGIVKDGNFITGRGPGFAIDFGLSIVEELQGKVKADEVAGGVLFRK